MASQGIPDDIKQQLDRKEREKEKKEKKIDELIEERKKLEEKLLETNDKDQSAKIQASIDRIEKDISRLENGLNHISEETKLLIGKRLFFNFFFYIFILNKARLRNSFLTFKKKKKNASSQSQAVHISSKSTRVHSLSPAGRYFLSFFLF
jgi:hypothetical protein